MYKRILLAALVAAMTLAPRAARAVVTNTNSAVSYDCTGVASAKTFAITYPYISPAQFAVTVTSVTGVVTTLTWTTHYTISPTSSNTGGTLTLVPDGTRCPAGSVLRIARAVPNTQSLSLSTQGPYSPKAIESALDLLTMQIQQTDAKISAPDIKAYVDQVVNNTLTGGTTVQPLTWALTGNGAAVTFTIPNAVVSSADLYVVTIDGVTQRPTTDYTVNSTVGQITFATAPATNSSISVRSFGYARALNVSDSSNVLATGSTTTVDLAHRFSYLPTVRDFGAKADGSDDTGPLQAALATGKCVFMPAGTYKVTAALTVPSGGCLIGAGSQSTTINFTGAGDLFTNATPTSRIYGWRFIDITATTATGVRCFYLSSVSSSYFRSVVCNGFTTGWDVFSPTSGFSIYNRWDDCTAQSSVTGYYIRGTSSNANVLNMSRANLFTSYGVRIADSNENHVVSSQIESSTGVGVSIEGSSPGLSYANSVTTSRFEGAMTCGIQTAANVSGTYVANNFFVSSVVGALCDSGTNTQVFGGSNTAGGPNLKMETQLAANTTGVGVPYALRRLSNGGVATLGTNDPMLELNDEATSAGNPTTLSVKTGRATGEYVRGSRAATRYWNITAPGSEFLAGGIAWGGIQFVTPTTGQTMNINADIVALVIKPAGTLAALTITMPAAPDNGQVIAISTTQTLTAVTLNPNSGQSIAANSGITTLAAGAAATYTYRLADTTWYRLH